MPFTAGCMGTAFLVEHNLFGVLLEQFIELAVIPPTIVLTQERLLSNYYVLTAVLQFLYPATYLLHVHNPRPHRICGLCIGLNPQALSS